MATNSVGVLLECKIVRKLENACIWAFALEENHIKFIRDFRRLFTMIAIESACLGILALTSLSSDLLLSSRLHRCTSVPSCPLAQPRRTGACGRGTSCFALTACPSRANLTNKCWSWWPTLLATAKSCSRSAGNWQMPVLEDFKFLFFFKHLFSIRMLQGDLWVKALMWDFLSNPFIFVWGSLSLRETKSVCAGVWGY